MQARVLFVTDLHSRNEDKSSIKGYCSANWAVVEDLKNAIVEEGITHVVFGGDIADRGVKDTAWVYKFYNNLLLPINNLVKGNMYNVIGNHLYLSVLDNPELYACLPSPFLPEIPQAQATNPLLQTPPFFTIGTVQISLLHYFAKDKTVYTREKQPGITTHVGVYHDECVIPADLLPFQADKEDLQRYYFNIDYAICNHIHTAYPPQKLMVGEKEVTLFIPGALAVTQNVDSAKHPKVKLPILTVEDDNSVTWSNREISTHLDMLTFYESRQKTLKKEKKDVDNLFIPSELPVDISIADLETFLIAKGCSDRTMEYIRHTVTSTSTAQIALDLLKEN